MGKNDLLAELGSCWRGDWSQFDGRTSRDQLDDWIELPATQKAFKQFREKNRMCPLGRGHWTEYCEDYDE